jgi:hypothetical protein
MWNRTLGLRGMTVASAKQVFLVNL